MKLSIIIPTLNEESLLEKNLASIKNQLSAITLKKVQGQLSAEIIVADGGSRDRTADIARRFADRVCISNEGRGNQMNAGAEVSGGDLFLFLHADSILYLSGIVSMLKVMEDNDVIGGAFRLKIDSKKILHKVVSYFANMRAGILGIAYGDQGIFVRRSIFYEVGGYPDIPIMEDVEFVRRLKRKGKFIILRECIATSSRRWDRGGILYTTIRNWILISLYLIGVSPNRLKGWYREHGG